MNAKHAKPRLRTGRVLIRFAAAAAASILVISALASIVAVAPEVYSPLFAAASNIYTETVNGATGECSSGWFNSSNLDVPAGIINTQVTLVGGGGGGSAAGSSAAGGVGGGAAQVIATISSAQMPAGSLLYAHLGCGGGAGSTSPAGGAGGAGESNAGQGTTSPTGSGAVGGTAQGNNAGGGGGGGSAVCVVSTASTNCSGGTMIGVAGGGGGAAGADNSGATGAAGGRGAASGSNGGAGSATGCTGSGGSGSCTGGGGGTSSAVGAPGTGSASGGAATNGAGGSGASAGNGLFFNQNAAGGGGAGGYFGGGGGSAGQNALFSGNAVSGTGGGAGSAFWNASYGTPTYSQITGSGANCGTSTTQCATSSTSNGQGGSSGHTGASGSLVVKFTVGAVAAHSSFSTEPSSSVASGAVIPTQPVITAGDYSGAAVNSDPIQLGIASQPSGPAATISCTTNPITPTAGGTASFAGCSISGPIGTYTLLATDTSDGVQIATSTTITLSPGTPTKLAFIQQPSNTAAGSTIAPAVTVAVEDAAGNVETANNSAQVSLAIGTNPGGGTLTGGALVTVHNGVATFSGLSINKTGTGYTLTAASLPSYTAATSSTFNVTAGLANRLIFVQNPTNAAAGSAVSPAVSVAVEDANGNVETGDNATQVSLAIGNNPGSGTLSGGSAVTVSAGIATFSSLSINKTGTGYTLVASSSPSYTAATSSSFYIAPGTATKLAYLQNPNNTAAGSAVSPAVSVAVEDANGNVETGDNATQVSLAIGNNPGSGTLSGGSAVTVSAGIATFSSLSINKTGIGYTLTASSSPSFTIANSSSFNITPGTPTKLAYLQNPNNTAAGSAVSPAVSVAVEDANGNVETGDNATQVSLAIGNNPGSGTLSGGSAVTVSAGIATFSSLSINATGNGYTLVASSNPAHGTATSSSFNITPGSANKLVFVQNPNNTAAGSAVTPAVTVAVEDANGNVESGDNSTQVSLAIGNNPGSGTLSGGSAVTVSAGVATFSSLSINKTGTGYTLTASSSPSFTIATSSSFNITPGVATKLAFVQNPTTTAAGSAVTPAVTVAVEDANGNVETGDNSTQVSLAIGNNPGSGTLSGGSAVTVSAGVATFSSLSINKTGAGYTLTASSNPSLTAATSAAFNITPGVATKLVFLQNPTSATSGSTVTPAVTVAIEDANGNVETGDNSTQVSLAIGTNPAGGTLSGGSAVTVSAGVATFSALSIDKAGAGYTLLASSSPSHTQATSSAFTIAPSGPTHLAFLQQPTNAQAGSSISPGVTVAVEDANGNVETGDNATQISLVIGTNPGSGTLSGGSAVPVAAGIATFSNLSIDLIGSGYTLVASSSPSYTAAVSATFTISPGLANHLAFVHGPTNTAAGSSVSPAVTLAIEDANGNIETGDNTTKISLAIASNPSGGTLAGGAAVTAVSGIATFAGLSIDKVGTGYTLTASSTPSYTLTTSTAFNITPGPSNTLAFIQNPSTTAAGNTMSPAVTVAVEDSSGNIETGDNSTQVTLAIGNNAGGGILIGGAAVTVVSGIATFSSLSIDKTGTGYTLTASSIPAFTVATSTAFDITPGSATRLAFLQGPSNAHAGTDSSPAVTVAVEDADGNIETGDNSTQVTLSIANNAGGGTLTGAGPVTVSAGVATFSSLSIDKVGSGYTLGASGNPLLTVATSSAFDVTPGAPSKLAFVQQPTTTATGTAISPAVSVAVEDADGNVVTSDNTTQVTVVIGTNPGGGSLTGGSAMTVSQGVATLSVLTIDKPGNGYTLSATSSPAFVAATSMPFNVASTGSQLVFIQGPSDTQAGSAISPAVTVAVEDASGNVETGDNGSQVSLAIGTNPGSGTLTGGSAVTVSSGVATFSSLSINKVGTGYTLTASSTPMFTPATSSAFNITPGAATQLAFIQGPSDTQAGSAISPAVTVAVEDASGNVETGDNGSQVSLAIGTNPGSGTLTGGSAVTVSSGVATFSSLSINKVGTGYTLTASSTPMFTPATSSAFNITPGAATQLAFIQGPSDTQAGSAISPAVTVAVEDASGNVETGDNGSQVSLAIGTNPGSGTLTGGSAVTVSSGVATFSSLSINKVGTGYTLTASSMPMFTPATSSEFSVSPGVVSQLTFEQQPTNTAVGTSVAPAVTVAVEDANGNVETGDNSTQISLAIGTNPSGGTLSGGSAVAVSSGVATFSVLSIDHLGNGYTLVTSSNPAYATATSSPFNVTAGPATQLAFVQGPSNAQAGSAISPAVTVAVEDANGNVETNDNTTTITLTIGTNPGGGTLSGGSATTAVSGIAAFSGLSIDKVGNGYNLKASSSPAYTRAISAGFEIAVGPATKLAFVVQPATAVAGTTISPPTQVVVEDADGNRETTDNSTQVTLAIGTNPSGGTLGGGSATTVTGGIASFANLSIDTIGAGYTLSATSSPAYTAAGSSAFDITGGELALGCSAPPSTTATTCTGINLPDLTLDGLEQTIQSAGNDLYVSDTRGLSNAGWSVSAYLTPTVGNANAACVNVATFCNASVGASAANPQGQIPASHFSIGGIICTAAGGNSSPEPLAGPGGSFPTASGAVGLCSAPAGHSSGTFKIGANYVLHVPEGIYSGQYKATVEYLAF